MDRKILIRVTIAPLLLAGLAAILYLDHRLQKPLGVTLLAGLFAILSYRELCEMGRLKGLHPAEEVGAAGLSLIFGLTALTFWTGRPLPGASAGAAIAFLMLILAGLVVRFGKFGPPDAGFSVLAFAYVSLIGFVVAGPASLPQLAFLIATNKGSDMAAYLIGKLLGRHKFAPVVSPAKTWEGAIAGLMVGGGLGAFILAGWMGVSGGAATGCAIGVTVAAQMGDLVKSAIKRWAGVKDSGRMLPEFGGALDMCDSFILSAPVAWALLQLAGR